MSFSSKKFIHNLPLNLLTLFFLVLTSGLGFWQINRAHEKNSLIQSYQAHSKKTLTSSEIINGQNLSFYHTDLFGTFLDDQTLLLDNKIDHGRVGYEIFSLFKIDGTDSHILVDRGFILAGTDRNQLPTIKSIRSPLHIKGILSPPPRFVQWGPMFDETIHGKIKRIEYLDIKKLSAHLDKKLIPLILVLQKNNSDAYPGSLQITPIGPERHYAYAFQWFALATTLLVLLWAFNRVKT